MNCRDIELDLVSFAKGELSPKEQETIDAHLSACATCREELAGIRKTLDALHQELVPVELSAHFRLALAERIDDATTMAAHARATGLSAVKASERHFAEERGPAVRRLWTHFRRSPYFALSLAAHAAVVALAVAILLHLQTGDKPVGTDNTRVELPSPAPHMASAPSAAEQAYLARRAARSVLKTGVRTETGVRVDISDFDTAGGAMVLVGDGDLRCVQAFLTDTPDTPTSEDVLARHKDAGALKIDVIHGAVEIPTVLANAYFDKTLALRVFDLLDAGRGERRLELWGQDRWTEFVSGLAAAPQLRAPIRMPLCAALLPRRESLTS